MASEPILMSVGSKLNFHRGGSLTLKEITKGGEQTAVFEVAHPDGRTQEFVLERHQTTKATLGGLERDVHVFSIASLIRRVEIEIEPLEDGEVVSQERGHDEEEWLLTGTD